ncbi:hypothetical protein NQ318_011764 [Aromia moschata]|uniref:Golgi integral membrane protein 4 n=1 Tax=Aromia moschata TaxID=1265417 RepID=A0AAV8Y1V5_9CUCU|nr:hypothetical protein NQ318_011764 [Aromia moschata]
MTTSRVIRGTRAKIFLYVCAVLILTGIIACYNNTLSQLDEVRRSNRICHQQEENLSTQLQVISDYKQRLEKSLKTEKAEHQQTKTNLENKLNEEASKYEKYSTDTKLKLNSLQQNYHLLEIRHGDFKEDCSKTQQKQLEEINALQSKLSEVQEELKKVEASKENLKSEYIKLQFENDELRKQVNDIQINKNENESNFNHLTKERNQLKKGIGIIEAFAQEFAERCPYDTLQEPKQIVEVSSEKSFIKIPEAIASPSQAQENRQLEAGVLNPPQVEKQEKSVLVVPNSIDAMNSVSKPSTKSGLKPSQPSLNGARPLLLPTMTPETINKNDMLGINNVDKQKLPDGVVAIPKEENNHNEPEIVNNRYQIAKESVNEHVDKKAVKEDMDKENGAHEVFDAPLGQNNLDELAFGDNDHIKQAEKPKLEKNHIDNLGVGDKKNYDPEQPIDYKELQNDALEEEDDDDYPDNQGRQGVAVRN